MVVRSYQIRHPLDLRLTLAPLARGPYDPTIRLATRRAWRATRTPDGPATVALVHAGDQLRAEAWGPGADRALADIPTLLGLDAEPAPIPDGHPLVAQLARRDTGIRIPRTAAVIESLIPAILEQKGHQRGGPPGDDRFDPGPRRNGARAGRVATPAPANTSGPGRVAGMDIRPVRVRLAADNASDRRARLPHPDGDDGARGRRQ